MNHVWVGLQFLHYLQFSVLITSILENLFDCHCFPGLSNGCLVNNSKCSVIDNSVGIICEISGGPLALFWIGYIRCTRTSSTVGTNIMNCADMLFCWRTFESSGRIHFIEAQQTLNNKKMDLNFKRCVTPDNSHLPLNRGSYRPR